MDDTKPERDENLGSMVWTDLQQLKSVAVGLGCTPAQFEMAVETVGKAPDTVFAYLQAHGFVPDPNDRKA